MRTVITLILASILGCFWLQEVEAVENNELVRASILEKIAQFIEWPPSSNPQFKLCAFDKTALMPALEVYYADSSLNDKPIRLVPFDSVESVLSCQIIYLGTADSRHLEKILQLTAEKPILVVAERKDLVSQGAHVDFFVEDDRLRLEVNRTSLAKSRLQASYQLLGVARIVE